MEARIQIPALTTQPRVHPSFPADQSVDTRRNLEKINCGKPNVAPALRPEVTALTRQKLDSVRRRCKPRPRQATGLAPNFIFKKVVELAIAVMHNMQVNSSAPSDLSYISICMKINNRMQISRN